MRPVLEYGSSVWDPPSVVLQEELESEQKRAARFVTGNYKYETGSMTGILGQLKWESLKKRRKDNRLILLYTGLKGKASIPTDDLIPKTRWVVIRTQMHYKSYKSKKFMQWMISSPTKKGLSIKYIKVQTENQKGRNYDHILSDYFFSDYQSIINHNDRRDNQLPFEPCHEIVVLFVLRKLILQTRMRSHPVGIDVWYLVRPFVYFNTSCVRTAKALAKLHRCAVAWAFAGHLCDKYHNLMSWLN